MIYTENCNLKNNKEEIVRAIDTILDPIAKTMSPRGANVMFVDGKGKLVVTNDGATIAKIINPEGQLEKMIVDAIVQASENTNKAEGDATSTTVLLTGAILKNYIGMSDTVTHYEYLDKLNNVKNHILEELEKSRLEPTEELLKKVAFISANNDSSISDVAYEVAQRSGDYGIISYDMKNPKTEYKFDEGFVIHEAVVDPFFLEGKPSVDLSGVGVFVTKQKMFYTEHLDVILKSFYDGGYQRVVIVSPDFTGKIPEHIIQINQSKRGMFVYPVHMENENVIDDIAAYLGTNVYTVGLGTPTAEKLANYMGIIHNMYASMQLLILKRDTSVKSEKLEERKKLLESMIDKDETIKDRLSSLTSGIVTLSVGGETEIERNERQLRFDDSIRAVKRAHIHGCLVGGGVAFKDIYSDSLASTSESLSHSIKRNILLAPMHNILSNSGDIEVDVLSCGNCIGYNAITKEFENLLDSGIIDSYPAVRQAFLNAVSTAEQLISVFNNTIVVNRFNKE